MRNVPRSWTKRIEKEKIVIMRESCDMSTRWPNLHLRRNLRKKEQNEADAVVRG